MIGLKGWMYDHSDWIEVDNSAFGYLLKLPAGRHNTFPAANEALVQISEMIEKWWRGKYGY